MLDVIGFVFIIGLLTIVFVLGFGIGYVLKLIDMYKHELKQRARDRK